MQIIGADTVTAATNRNLLPNCVRSVSGVQFFHPEVMRAQSGLLLLCGVLLTLVAMRTIKPEMRLFVITLHVSMLKVQGS